MQGTTTDNRPRRGDEAFESALCMLIREWTGLTLQSHQLPNLRATVDEGVRRFGHADAAAWLRRLRACDGHGAELDFLLERITIGESYFFRDASQMAFLRDTWLPALVNARRRGQRRVRIWSAGCSQGQEIYSLAILLRETLPDFERWQVELLGTDISEAALADARRASYAEWSFRTMPAALRERYFTRCSARSQLLESVRSLVSFARLNLAAETYACAAGSLHDVDLILCRNVFIYFDRATAREATRRLGGCLAPEGVLLLGASDPVESRVEGLALERRDGVFWHRRVPSGGRSVAPCPPPAPAALEPEAPRQSGPPAVPRADESDGAPRDEPAALLALARASADGGDFDAAHDALGRLLALDPLAADAHFLAALVHIDRGDARAAETSLRRTLFLAPDRAEAHQQLGMLLLRRGERVEAMRCLENARRVAADKGAEAPADADSASGGDPEAWHPERETGALREAQRAMTRSR